MRYMVRDVDEAVAFYVSKLGFERIEQMERELTELVEKGSPRAQGSEIVTWLSATARRVVPRVHHRCS